MDNKLCILNVQLVSQYINCKLILLNNLQPYSEMFSSSD